MARADHWRWVSTPRWRRVSSKVTSSDQRQQNNSTPLNSDLLALRQGVVAARGQFGQGRPLLWFAPAPPRGHRRGPAEQPGIQAQAGDQGRLGAEAFPAQFDAGITPVADQHPAAASQPARDQAHHHERPVHHGTVALARRFIGPRRGGQQGEKRQRPRPRTPGHRDQRARFRTRC